MINFIFGDFIACLNNAKRLHAKSISVRNTTFNFNMLILLQKIGIIRGFKFVNNLKIEVMLKYVKNNAVFKNLKLVSKPSRRIRVDLIKLKKLKDNTNTSIYIVSTDKGLKTDLECLLNGVSGEIILKIDL